MFRSSKSTLSLPLKFIRGKFKPDDLYVIEQFETEFLYGIKNYVEVKCSNERCGEQSEVKFTFDLSTFFPNVSDSRRVRDRIFSRKTSKAGNNVNGSDGLCTSSVDEKPSSSGATGATTTGQEISDNLVTVSDINQVR
jgi:hypothetical protein